MCNGGRGKFAGIPQSQGDSGGNKCTTKARTLLSSLERLGEKKLREKNGGKVIRGLVTSSHCVRKPL